MDNREDELCSEFRERWQSNPVYDGNLEFLGESIGVGSSPQRVRLLPDGCIAYAKRALTVDKVPEGAHEYIAARLAHMIGVPVPPVGFCNDSKGNHFSLSIRAFPETIHWNETHIPDVDIDVLRPIFSAAAVFHAWIADIDHAAHPENLVVDANYPEGQPWVAFIDHAMSLTATWRAGAPAASLPNEYYIPPDKVVRESVMTTLQRARGVSERVRESMISRVPPGLLPPTKAAVILDCLRCRATELTAAFATTTGEC